MSKLMHYHVDVKLPKALMLIEPEMYEFTLDGMGEAVRKLIAKSN